MSSVPDTCDGIATAPDASSYRAELVAAVVLELTEAELVALVEAYGDGDCPAVTPTDERSEDGARHAVETWWTGGCTATTGWTFEGELVRGEVDVVHADGALTETRTLLATGFVVTAPDGTVAAEAFLDWSSTYWMDTFLNYRTMDTAASGALRLASTGDALDFTATYAGAYFEGTRFQASYTFLGTSGACALDAASSFAVSPHEGRTRIALPGILVESEYVYETCGGAETLHGATWVDGAWVAGPLWVDGEEYTGSWTDDDRDTLPSPQSDCDDADPSVNDCAIEVWDDGVDQDCDGADVSDVDGDGVASEAAGGTDCDDDDATVYPGAEEVPYDRRDQDCDGADLDDLDADGLEHDDDCDDADASAYPGASEVSCDDVDQDCDGADDRTGCPPPATTDADTHGPDADTGCGAGCGGGAAAVLLPLLLGVTRRRAR